MTIIRVYCKDSAFVRGCIGMTQKQLSKITGLSLQTISRVENKNGNPQGRTRLIIGLIMYDALMKSSIPSKLKEDLFEEYFIIEKIEL